MTTEIDQRIADIERLIRDGLVTPRAGRRMIAEVEKLKAIPPGSIKIKYEQ